MFNEDDLLPISALQHLAFCERQWGLMYLEHIWAENVLTAEGSQMHEKADSGETEVRGNLRIARSLRVRSLNFGLTGITDVVEFHRTDADSTDVKSNSDNIGVTLKNVEGLWMP
ncbi:MAG: Dna2/Cas4 domain-containing protein, partial [Bacteroidota bacterium]|nr:Dna2/Cas4 domain-containing protein [Bacteroidota bacterium]